MNNKKDKLLIGLIVGILLLSIIPFRLSYAETENSEETVESSSSSLEKVNNIDTTGIIESSSAVADPIVESSESSSSNKDSMKQSTETSTQESTTETKEGEQTKTINNSSTVPTTLTELENFWDIYIDHTVTHPNVTLLAYKWGAPSDVIIPGSVLGNNGLEYKVWVRFTPDGGDPWNPDTSIWKHWWSASFDPKNKITEGTIPITSVTVKKIGKFAPEVVGTMAYAFSQGTNVVSGHEKEVFTELESLDLRNLETWNVTDMFALVQNAQKLTTVDVSGLYVQKVTNLANAFYLNKNLKRVMGLETWRPEKAQVLGYLFSADINLNQDDIRAVLGWFNGYAPQVENIEYMFYNCHQLTGELDLSNWQNVAPYITNMRGTFMGAKNLTKIILPNNLENVVLMNETFWSTSALKEIEGLSEITFNTVQTMEDTFNNSGVEVLNLKNFQGVQLANNMINTFSYGSKKNLLILNNDSITNNNNPLKKYNYSQDNRVKFNFPYLDPNGGEFPDKKTDNKPYIKGIVEDSSIVNKLEIDNFVNNNKPKKKGFDFTGWSPLSLDINITPDKIEACVGSGDLLEYISLSIYFKANWQPAVPNPGTENKPTLPDQIGDLGIAYVPKQFSFPQTTLSDATSVQEITLNDSTQHYNLGVRDYLVPNKDWKLTARLEWLNGKSIPGSTILTSNPGTVKINTNNSVDYKENLLVDQSDDPTMSDRLVKGVRELEITTKEAKEVMSVAEGFQQATFDYDLGTVKLKIEDPSIVRPGTYQGNINWNLSVVPSTTP